MCRRSGEPVPGESEFLEACFLHTVPEKQHPGNLLTARQRSLLTLSSGTNPESASFFADIWFLRSSVLFVGVCKFLNVMALALARASSTEYSRCQLNPARYLRCHRQQSRLSL